MLAARDQENLAHARQTTAASKPLNQEARQLQPKTPGNKVPKTPFRVPVNDENNPLAFGTGKQTIRGTRPGNENVVKTGKDGLREKQPLATPAGPKNRAPLGMKTTNAKAKAFQTPAPPSEAPKPLRSAKRSSNTRKVKQSVPTQNLSEAVSKEPVDLDDDRDIEYMPPKPQPLPDIPDDIVYDTSFPQFKGRNLGRGWDTLYVDDKVGEDGLTQKEREYKEASDAYDKKIEDLIQKDLDDVGLQGREFPDELGEEDRADRRPATKKVTVKKEPVPTVKSRSAVKALAQKPPTTTSQPKARPQSRTASKPGITSALGSRKKTPAPSNPSSMRHTAAVVNSKSTVGYSKGRNVSSALGPRSLKQEQGKNNKSSKSILSPEKYMELYGEPQFGSEMWSRCKAAGCFDPEPSDSEEHLEPILPAYEEDEETANFQLTL